MKEGTQTTENTLRKVHPLKERVLNLRPLPMGWRQIFVQHHPEYDNAKGLSRLSNVSAVHASVTDEDITKKMEALFGKK